MDGTNFPPTAADPLSDRLAEQYADLRARAAELVAAMERVPETVDDAVLPKATAFVKQLKECGKRVEDARKKEGEDFLKAKRTVDGWFGQVADSLKNAATTIERRINLHLQAKAAEERRRREEEAKRLAEEAAKKAAAMQADEDLEAAIAAERAAEQAKRQASAKAADMARSHGELGSVATLRTSIAFEVTDKKEAVKQMAAYFDDLAVDKAVRGFVRQNAEEIRRHIDEKRPGVVPGIRFFLEEKALVR